MKGCCEDYTGDSETASHGVSVGCARCLRDLAGWIAPGAALVIVPKCPACVAAYIAVATGVGVSITTAAHIRFALISVCAAALAFAAARRFGSHPLFSRNNQ